ncbi:MAG: hypothetical protein AAFW59_08235 [Pseudomonadota bacterium]
MTILGKSIVPAALLALAACGAPAEEDTAAASQADDYAARINGEKSAQADAPAAESTPGAPVAAPTVAEPLETIASGPFNPGTATDPNTACNANLFGQFIGQQPDADVRAQILEVANDVTEVRFIAPGGDYIKPDPTNPRLNVMIAVDGIIRDIRCG